MKKNYQLLSIAFIALLLVPFAMKAQDVVPDTIVASDDTFIKRTDNTPGGNGFSNVLGVLNAGDRWEHPDLGYIGDGYKNEYSRMTFIKFDLSELPAADTIQIDSVVFNITPRPYYFGSFEGMLDPPNVTNYIAHVPVTPGLSDNWDEATMFFDLAVLYWSYDQGTEGDNWWWFREAVNDTSMIGSIDINSETDSTIKTLNITEAVTSEESDFLTLAIYDRDRDPDWWSFDNSVREGVRIMYRSKDDEKTTKNKKPVLLVYSSKKQSNGVMRKDAANKIKCYPNPVTDYLTIELNNNQNAVMEILDITGRTLLKKELSTARSKISLGDLSRGYYILKIDNGITPFTKKIIKE